MFDRGWVLHYVWAEAALAAWAVTLLGPLLSLAYLCYYFLLDQSLLNLFKQTNHFFIIPQFLQNKRNYIKLF